MALQQRALAGAGLALQQQGLDAVFAQRRVMHVQQQRGQAGPGLGGETRCLAIRPRRGLQGQRHEAHVQFAPVHPRPVGPAGDAVVPQVTHLVALAPGGVEQQALALAFSRRRRGLIVVLLGLAAQRHQAQHRLEGRPRLGHPGQGLQQFQQAGHGVGLHVGQVTGVEFACVVRMQKQVLRVDGAGAAGPAVLVGLGLVGRRAHFMQHAALVNGDADAG